MSSSYSVNLGIEKPAPGEQTGVWSGTVNTDFDLIDQAVNGILSGDTAVVLAAAGTTGAPNTMTISEGSLSDGRNAYIEYTDAGADPFSANSYVQLVSPLDAAKKIVYIRNNLSGNRSLYVFQGTYSVSRDFIIGNGAVAIVKFDGKGLSASSASSVLSGLQLEGITLPNTALFKWANAAGDDFISMTADAADDIIIEVNGTTVVQYDSSEADWLFTGDISATNLSGTNTGDNSAAAEGTAGIAALATQVEVNAGTEAAKVVTPATLAGWTGGGGSSSPLTTKGDLWCFSTVDARLPAGTNGYVLSANSAVGTGLEWIAVSSGGLGNVVEDTTPQLGGDLDGNNKWINLTNAGTARGLKCYEPIGGGTKAISLIAPAMSADWTLTLPSVNGTNGQYLKTNGSGVTSWATPASGDTGVPAILSDGDVPTLNTGITAAEVRTLIGAGTGDGTGDGTVTSVAAGTGMSFSTITGSGSVALGTPGSCTSTSSNTAAGAHTHAIDSTIARVASPTFTGTVTSDFFNATSARDKKTEVEFDIDAENLLLVETICYTLNADKVKRVMMGAFADDMLKLFPHCVSLDANGKPIGIDYSRLVIPLIMKIQELEARLAAKGI
jgi:hypothetical protein